MKFAGIFGFEGRELAWEGRKIGTMYVLMECKIVFTSDVESSS
jgi:hypothetical protein